MARRTAKVKMFRSNKLTLALLAVLILAMGIMLQNMNAQLKHARREQEVYANRLSALQEANARLSADIANRGNSDLIEDIARNDLGMAARGEKIFRFQS